MYCFSNWYSSVLFITAKNFPDGAVWLRGCSTARLTAYYLLLTARRATYYLLLATYCLLLTTHRSASRSS
eukprot:scaffold50463_cov53-Phaeocystis_antarctica.AAC.1